MKKKTDFTTDGFEVLGYFLLTAITVIVFAYITNWIRQDMDNNNINK